MSETNLMTSLLSAKEPAWDWSIARETQMDSEGIRQIFWCEIWAPLSSAKRHDNSRIVALFLDSLFEEALFDDEGAWIVAKAGSLQLPRPQNTKECPGSSLLH